MAALAAAAYGLASATLAAASADIGVDDTAALVLHVVPGTPAWRDGIRAGDSIAAFSASTDPGGWSLVVTRGALRLGTSAVGNDAALRATAQWAEAGLVLALLGLVLVARGRPVGLAFAGAGSALGAIPLVNTGSIRDLVIGGLATFALSGLATATLRPSRREGAVAIAAGSALSVAWVASVLTVPGMFDALDAARLPFAGALALWGGSASPEWSREWRRLQAPDGPRVFDLVWLPALAAVLGAAVLLGGLHPLAALGVLGLAVAAYPLTRRLAVRGFEALVVGNIRRQAQFSAAEDERGRVAREIHDSPLQEIAAVIRRLEASPTAAGEATALREVAAHLREVASTLRSPVLDDLGIGPALQDLGDALVAANPERRVLVQVDDFSAGGRRPPAEVEVAAFRVAQEASGNALRHSAGSLVRIAATVDAAAVDVAISDNGVGIDRDAAARSRRAGHFGLDSMRERAAAVGGRVEITSGAEGTVVHFTWEAAQ
jgi:signal transduction histidine kinase